MKVITETENYVLVQVDGGNQGHPDWSKAMAAMLTHMEAMLDKGWRPLHYVPRVSAWVCEKERMSKAA